MNFEAAADYARRHDLEALLVRRDGETLFEAYAPGFDASTPHALYSGTKSFWGIVAIAARADGLLELDETVGATFSQWNAGYRKTVTLRMLLQLTSGIGFGGLGSAVPTYERALESDIKNVPGAAFTYGGIPLQVFGAVLAAKLVAMRQTPHEYLTERILAPIGMKIDRWRDLRDGSKPLPTGAFVSALEWSKYGRLILEHGAYEGRPVVPEGSTSACFEGSSANPRYGLGWWLDTARPGAAIVYASGSGGQAMYVLGEQRCTVVKFGRGASYAHEAFLKRLLS